MDLQAWKQWNAEEWNHQLLRFCFVQEAETEAWQGIRASEDDLPVLTGDEETSGTDQAQALIRALRVQARHHQDALTPAALLERVARIPATASPASGASGSSASEQQPSSTGRVPPSPCLDIVLLDGTWNQVRQIFRTLPDAVPKVVISPKAGSERSVFGTAVRKQGKAREEAGRISTIEAYAQQRRST